MIFKKCVKIYSNYTVWHVKLTKLSIKALSDQVSIKFSRFPLSKLISCITKLILNLENKKD